MLDLVLKLGHVLLLLLPADAGWLSVLYHPLLPLDVPQLLRGGGDGGSPSHQGAGTGLGLHDDLSRGGRPGLVTDQHQGRRLTEAGGDCRLAQLGDGDLASEGDVGGGEGLGEDRVDGGQQVVVDWGEGRGVLLAAAGGGRLRLDAVAVAAVRVGVWEVLHQDVVQHSWLQTLNGRQAGGCHAAAAEICNTMFLL